MGEVSLKQLLTKRCEEKGYSCDADNNADFYEWFEIVSDVVWIGEPDTHRWYTRYEVVRKLTVGGIEYFFSDDCWDVSGDNSAEDCGWECPDIDQIQQVFPKQVLTTIYVTQDKL